MTGFEIVGIMWLLSFTYAITTGNPPPLDIPLLGG